MSHCLFIGGKIMEKKICSLIVVVMLVGITLSSSFASSRVLKEEPAAKETEEWYYLPSFPNYAPMGLPDFDQRQDNWMSSEGIWFFIRGVWSFCGPTSLADIFWWFDSKHENPQGSPGDGNDTYPLVRDYHAPGTPTPGPNTDDHNFNNANDPLTSWNHGRGGKELIENVAWYCNTNLCRFLFIRGFSGTYPQFLELGAKQWIKDAGLQDRYHVETIWKPDFSVINKHLRDNDGIIVNLLFYNPKAIVFHTLLGHYVAVARINTDGYIALSDPVQNKINPGPDPTAHNDAGVVSYDIYKVNFTSPYSDRASWWIEDFYDPGVVKFGGLAQYALIISETV
jgi:hypothetical protein